MESETATAVPRSPVSVALAIRGHTVVQDKPPASGGRDEGPMASELLLASLLACQHSTLCKIAAKRRTQATVKSIRGDLHFDGAGDIERVELHYDFEAPPEVSGEALETLLRLTDKACTISKALKVHVGSHYSRSPPAPPAPSPASSAGPASASPASSASSR